MLGKIIFLFAVGFLHDSFAEPIEHSIQTVDMESLISSPELYSGKRVKFVGWITMRPENVNMWVSKTDLDSYNREKCISLRNRFKDPEMRRKVDGKKVEIEGTFTHDARYDSSGNPYLRLAACGKLGLDFDTETLRVVEE